MTETVLWRRLDLPGHEIARLDECDHGRELSGTALFSCNEGPTRLDYAVVSDSCWRTDSAHVVGMISGRRMDLAVSVDAGRRWHLNGVERGPSKRALT